MLSWVQLFWLMYAMFQYQQKMQLRLRHVMMKQTKKKHWQCHQRFDRSKRTVHEEYVIFTISGRCVFSRGVTTNQKQTQHQEEKHDTPLVTVPGYDRYPEKIHKGSMDRTLESASTSCFWHAALSFSVWSSSVPFRANNPVLVNAFWKSIHELQQEPNKDVQWWWCGALFHHLPRPRGSIWWCVSDVCQSCETKIWHSCYCFWWIHKWTFNKRCYTFEKNRDLFRCYSAFHWW